jgi:hypothetical protein
VQCSHRRVPAAGPNLILGRDGTLYNSGNDNTLRPIGIRIDGRSPLTVTANLIKDVPDAIFYGDTIQTAPDLKLGPDAKVILNGKKVIFAPGFGVAAGASLRVMIER